MNALLLKFFQMKSCFMFQSFKTARIPGCYEAANFALIVESVLIARSNSLEYNDHQCTLDSEDAYWHTTAG